MIELLSRKYKRLSDIMLAISIWCLIAALPCLVLYRIYDRVILDLFYIFVDGYKVEAYITKSEYEQGGYPHYVEISDVGGRKYKMTYFWNRRINEQKQKEENRIGKQIFIRRSTFLDKWNFWERDPFSFREIIIAIIFITILGYFTVALIKEWRNKYGPNPTSMPSPPTSSPSKTTPLAHTYSLRRKPYK